MRQLAEQRVVLREGEAVALHLITGDLDVSAIGTVTYVDGDKVLAFGHPLYNLGPVSYGMAKAKVITVVPTLDNPYKMAVAGSADYVHCFEATHADPLQAMQQVLRQVETWRDKLRYGG